MKKYLLATAERAIKTFAQSAIAAIGADAISIIDIDWWGVGSIALAAAIISILTSLTQISLTGTTGVSTE